MKTKSKKRDYRYQFASVRLFEPEKYKEFQEVCRREYSDGNKEINRHIARVAEAGTTAI